MKSIFPLLSLVAGMGLILAPGPVRANGQLSAKNLDVVDQWGWFTPGFKSAVHELVDTKQATAAIQLENQDLDATLPVLQKQAADAQAQVATLKLQLEKYNHTDESDFDQLKKMTGDVNVKSDDVRITAQTYIWAYPASPHQAEAQQILQTIQTKMADQTQAEKDAEAARVAAHALLVQRAQARQLSLSEWRDFLRDMSEDDVLKYMGHPTYRNTDYWTYSGEWTEDPETHQKIGLQINFNAARVNSVSQAAVK